jgi:predicted ferric reductase
LSRNFFLPVSLLISPANLFEIDVSLVLSSTMFNSLSTRHVFLDVVHLKFVRPPDFVYRSGQWIRLFCTAFCPHESHPFTLTSMPHDSYLSVHVKSQGIWTWKLREAFDANSLAEQRHLQPRLRIEGPFGGGNQDWYKYEVAVMIGAGMGVTPYASILKDLVRYKDFVFSMESDL